MTPAGLGEALKSSLLFIRHELVLLQERLKQINEWLGEEVNAFLPG